MSKKAVALTGAQREAALKSVAGKLAAEIGSSNVTRRQVAKNAGVAESLVSQYFGTTPELQKVARAAAKKMGLKEPTKAEQAAIGVEQRKHKVRTKRDTRKRSVKEVQAIKRKASPGKKLASRLGPVRPIRGASPKAGKGKSASTPQTASSAADRETKPVTKRETKPTGPKSKPVAPSRETKPTGPTERKSAARKPKAPPVAVTDSIEMPPLPDNLVGSFP